MHHHWGAMEQSNGFDNSAGETSTTRFSLRVQMHRGLTLSIAVITGSTTPLHSRLGRKGAQGSLLLMPVCANS